MKNEVGLASAGITRKSCLSMRPSKKHFTDINNNFADVFEENEFYTDILF